MIHTSKQIMISSNLKNNKSKDSNKIGKGHRSLKSSIVPIDFGY